MGLFDFMGKKSPEAPAKKANPRDVAKLERVVGNKMSQNYDRQEAIEQLSQMGTRESAAALLKRFDWLMDPAITDQEEKEAAMAGIVNAGEAALPAIRNYCKRAESLTWPLKILREIVPTEQLADEVLLMLDNFDTEYTRNVEPKVQLLAFLADYPSEDVRIAVEPFLQDTSEPVRFTASTTLFAVNDAQSVPALVALLDDEESLRVKRRVAQGLAERKWPISDDLLELCREALPSGFRLSEGRVIEA